MGGFLATLRTLPQQVLMAAVRGYRLLLSPWLGSSCRFEPTCSAFALRALELHGAAAGSYLTLHRLARCNPLCAGGHDPVPEHPRRLFAWAARSRARMQPQPSSTPTHKTSP